MADFWSAVSAIATSISTLIVFIAALIALGQVREATRARHVQALLSMFADFHTTQARDDRQFVYSQKFTDYKNYTPEIRSRLDRVIGQYQRAAILVSYSLIPEKIILETYSGTYVAAWLNLEDYIRSKRIRTNLANFGAAFEAFALRSKEYRFKLFGQSQLDFSLSYEDRTAAATLVAAKRGDA